MPSRFDLTYTDSEDKQQTPLCIHRAPLGTHERFIGFLIEHFAGNFPLWLAPVQIAIITISDKFNDYARLIDGELKKHKIRVELDLRSEKMGAKVRDAELKKIPIMLIVGENETKNNTVSVRRRFEGNIGEFKFEDYLKSIKEEIDNKKRRNLK